jgi:hypothetical protein
MIICNDCGNHFEEPKIHKEHHPYGMGSAVEVFAVCPYCNSTDIDEAEQCEECYEWVSVKEFDGGLCKNCQEVMCDV